MKGKVPAAGENCEAGWSAACHRQERGSVSYGVCRVAVVWRRMRAVGGFGELPVSSYDLFSSTERLGRAARDRMLARLSTAPTRSGRCRWVPAPP
jgi:putative transposase